MGSSGQPSEFDFDSGIDADASSDDEARALDYSDMPTYRAEEQRAQCFFRAPETYALMEAIDEEARP
eukprot:1804401-Pyramimonas_sp.AAC.1